MVRITRAEVEHILGPVDDNGLAAIQATGASLKDIAEAQAIFTGQSDIVGQGEQVIAGPVREVLTILRGTASGG